MSMKLLLVVCCMALSVSACQSNTESRQQKQSTKLSPATNAAIDTIAQSLEIKYQQVDNRPSAQCDQQVEGGNCYKANLRLSTHKAINSTQWKIYFSHITPIQSIESEEFTINHVNGDLHVIEPTDKFTGFKTNETKVITFYADFWSLSETDAMPNYIVVNNNDYAKVVNSTRAIIDEDTGLELLPFVMPYTDTERQFKRTKNDKTQRLTAERLYERNKKYDFSSYVTQNQQSTSVIAQQIIPTPSYSKFSSTRTLNISEGLHFNFNNVNKNKVTAAINRLEKLGIKRTNSALAINVNLHLVANSTDPLGSYQLAIKADAIDINAVDESGIFYAIQSLASLYKVTSDTLPVGDVKDLPHYQFRGILVDVARNFRDKNFILKLLDQMGAYKLNKLHLHLGDDEGWRLAIPSLPELTQVGSKRCFDKTEQQCLLPQLGAGVDASSEANGFYSVADYQEILKAASARHIQVIPSLDMPGHSRAAIKSMTARYNKYLKQGETLKAEQFLLHDPSDTTQYSSVQYYNDNTINVCLESSYAFINEVMQQVKAIHSEAKHPLTRYHIGADETAGAWVSSPACAQYIKNNDFGITKLSQLGSHFIERIANMLESMDIETAAWSDGLSHTNLQNMPAVVQANSWGLLMWNGHQLAHQFVNQDWQVVLSNPDVLYFDFPYEADPKEPGYYWGSRHINTEKVFQFMPDNLPAHAEFWLDREDNLYVADDTLKLDEAGNIKSAPLTANKHVLGIQGQLWSENTRTNNMAEYKLFPRLLSLAERAWHKASWSVPYDYNGFVYSQNSDRFTKQLTQLRDLKWQTFSATLGLKEFAKLEAENIHFRIPNVGAQIVKSTLFANLAYPGFLIEYKTVDGQWSDYKQPVKVDADIWVRAKTISGNRFGRALKVAHP